MTLFEEKMRATQPLEWMDYTTALAVSGGADSVAMLRFFADLREKEKTSWRLVVLHANHQLRGEESDGDEQFVRELCASLGLPCVCERLEISRTSNGLEQDARDARYAFLKKATLEAGARYLFTAHNQNDQVETVLHRILRGTGIAGLTGIARSRVFLEGFVLLRPLLGVTRAEILEYLASLGQTYRVDSSNDDVHLTRNRIRHTLLPLLREEFNPKLDEALLRLRGIANDVQELLDDKSDETLFHVLSGKKPSLTVLLDVLRSQPNALRREVFHKIWQRYDLPLRDMGNEQWSELLALLWCEGIRLFPGDIRVESRGNTLTIQWNGDSPKAR